MENLTQISNVRNAETPGICLRSRVPLLALAIMALLAAFPFAAFAQYAPPTSGMALWLSADSGISLTGSNITGWADQSTSGNSAAQASTSNGPTLLSSAINGKPAVHFDGSSSYLSIASIANDFSPGCTAFVVARPTNVASYQRFFDFGNGANANNIIFYRMGTSSTLEYATTTGSTVDANLMASGAIVQNQFTIYEVAQDTTTGVLYTNGNQVTNGGVTATPTGTRTSNFIGKSNWSADSLYQGDIAEIIVYNRRLTDAERQTVEDYLNVKYAVVPAPSAPTALTVLAVSGDEVELAWTNGAVPPATYFLQREAPGDSSFTTIATLAGTTTFYLDSGLTTGVNYTYRLVGFSLGETVNSANITGTPNGSNSLPPGNELSLWLSGDAGVMGSNQFYYQYIGNGVVTAQPTGNTSVISWFDQSGNNNTGFFPAGGYDQPVLVPNILNGKPVMLFDGAALFDFPKTVTSLSGGEAFVVVSAGSSTGGNGLWNFGSAGGTLYSYGDGNIYDSFGSATQQNEGSPNYDITQYHIYDVSSLPGLWESWVNGVPFYETFTNTVGVSTTPQIGSDGARGFGFYGSIAEILVYGQPLSGPQRQAVLGYLAQKYALIAAPAAPTGLAATSLNGTSALVSWESPVMNTPVTFSIMRQQDGGAWTSLPTATSACTFVDTGLSPTSTYSYIVQASDAGGASGWTSAATLNPSVQTNGVFPSTGVALWLMADGAIESSLGYLADYSGNGNDARQSNYASQPQIVPNILNGKPVMRFSGGQFLRLPNLMNGATAGEVMIVLRAANAAGTSGLWTFGTVGSSLYPYSDGTIYDDFGSSTRYATGAASQDITQFHVYEASSQAGLWESWMDGVPLFQSKTNASAFTSSPLLGYNSAVGGTNYFSGDIAEIIVFNRTLSAAERSGMLTYFNQKYALLQPPAAATKIAAIQLSATENLISWDWNPGNSQISYIILRKTGSGGNYSAIATVTGVGTYLDSTAVPGQQYFYEVVAENAAGSGPISAEASVATPMAEGGSVASAGMSLWLMADGAWESPIGYLADYSGNGYDAWQNSPSARPLLSANTLNGKPVMHFSGGQFLRMPYFMSGAAAGEAIIVLRAATSTVSSGLWTLGAVGSSLYPYSDGTIYDDFGSTNRYLEGAPSQDITQFHIYDASSQAGLWESWMDGVPLFQSTTNTVGFSSAPLLGYNSAIGGTNYFSGDVAEIIVYNRALSAVERQAIWTYYSQKYALSSAPPAPTGLQALALNANTALVSWDASLTTANSEFVVWRQQDGGSWTQIATTQGVQIYEDTGLLATSTYSYEVQAINSGGTGPLSAAVALNLGLTPVSALPTSGMQMWLMADGAWESPVGYLADYSGNGNDAWQTSYVNRPTLLPNVQNGKPVLHFNGAFAQTLGLPNILNGATAGEALILVRSNTNTSAQGLWNFGTGPGSFYPYEAGVLFENFGTTSQYAEGFSTDLTQFHVYEVSSQAGSWQSWIDGVPLRQSSTNTVGFATSSVLGQNGSRNYFSGDVAEVVVYNRVLTTQERQTWLQYFALKYLLGNFDPTGDGLTTSQKLQLGLNPLSSYTSTGNPITDATAIAVGLNPANPISFYPNPNGPPTPVTPPLTPGVPVITLTSPAGVVLQP